MPVNASNCDFGWKAKDFRLLSVDGKLYSLELLKGNLPNHSLKSLGMWCYHIGIDFWNNYYTVPNLLRKTSITTYNS